MRVTTETGLALGFVRLNEQIAEVAYAAGASGLSVNQVLRIDGNLWKVKKLSPSEYVANLMVASLWLIG